MVTHQTGTSAGLYFPTMERMSNNIGNNRRMSKNNGGLPGLQSFAHEVEPIHIQNLPFFKAMFNENLSISPGMNSNCVKVT